MNFREKEFVAIFGTSGSGKTTCLNVIGGLDQYDSGDLIINGRSTKEFKDVDWDAYRNNSVGFIFQSYNLITHLSINVIIENGTDLENVAQLNPLHAIVLILISLVLTVIGGSIPAKIAAKKDPVEALRSE